MQSVMVEIPLEVAALVARHYFCSESTLQHIALTGTCPHPAIQGVLEQRILHLYLTHIQEVVDVIVDRVVLWEVVLVVWEDQTLKLVFLQRHLRLLVGLNISIIESENSIYYVLYNLLVKNNVFFDKLHKVMFFSSQFIQNAMLTEEK